MPATNTDTQYTIQSITDANTCTGSAIGTVTVHRAAYPEVELGTYDSICRDQSVELSVPQVEGYTYLWSTGATTSSLTVDYSMAVDEVADISVEVTNAFGCAATDSIQILFKSCVGITEYNSQSIVLMPNPNDGSFSIDVSALQHSIVGISIYNAVGSKVVQVPFRTDDERIQVQQSNLPQGMYILYLLTQKGDVIRKPFVVK